MKMTVPCFVICQAVRKSEEIGIKTHRSTSSEVLSVFPTEEDARKSLLQVIAHIRNEQKLGLRGKDNLDPNKALDFCITEAEIVVPLDKMIQRGWTF